MAIAKRDYFWNKLKRARKEYERRTGKPTEKEAMTIEFLAPEMAGGMTVDVAGFSSPGEAIANARRMDMTGAGANGVIEPNNPVALLDTTSGPSMIHEGELFVQPSGAPPNTRQVLSNAQLNEIERRYNVPGMFSGSRAYPNWRRQDVLKRIQRDYPMRGYQFGSQTVRDVIPEEYAVNPNWSERVPTGTTAEPLVETAGVQVPTIPAGMPTVTGVGPERVARDPTSLISPTRAGMPTGGAPVGQVVNPAYQPVPMAAPLVEPRTAPVQEFAVIPPTEGEQFVPGPVTMAPMTKVYGPAPTYLGPEEAPAEAGVEVPEWAKTMYGAGTEEGYAILRDIARGESPALRVAQREAQQKLAAQQQYEDVALSQNLEQMGIEGITAATLTAMSERGQGRAMAQLITDMAKQRGISAEEAARDLVTLGQAGERLDLDKLRYDLEKERLSLDARRVDLAEADFEFMVRKYGDEEAIRMANEVALDVGLDAINERRARSGLPPITQEDYNRIYEAGPQGTKRYNRIMDQISARVAQRDYRGANQLAIDNGLPTIDYSKAENIEALQQADTMMNSAMQMIQDLPDNAPEQLYAYFARQYMDGYKQKMALFDIPFEDAELDTLIDTLYTEEDLGNDEVRLSNFVSSTVLDWWTEGAGMRLQGMIGGDYANLDAIINDPNSTTKEIRDASEKMGSLIWAMYRADTKGEVTDAESTILEDAGVLGAFTLPKKKLEETEMPVEPFDEIAQRIIEAGPSDERYDRVLQQQVDEVLTWGKGIPAGTTADSPLYQKLLEDPRTQHGIGTWGETSGQGAGKNNAYWSGLEDKKAGDIIEINGKLFVFVSREETELTGYNRVDYTLMDPITKKKYSFKASTDIGSSRNSFHDFLDAAELW